MRTGSSYNGALLPARDGATSRRPQRRLLLALGAICAASAVALGWLSWELITRDRTAEAQRDQESLEAAADRVVQAFEHQIADVESRLSEALDRGVGENPNDDPGITV